jgi:L-alanine-DL-glutamate epimerase-like enolase superfamily enzyme
VKITKIETFRPLSHPSSLWVEVHDDKGNVGLGESFFSQTVVEEYIHTIAAPLIFASGSVNPESLNFTLTPYVGYQGGGIEVRSLGALDIAVWDLWGKRINATMADSLGGKLQDSVKIYNTCAGSSYMKKTSSQNSKNWGVAESDENRYEDLQAFLNTPAKLARELSDSGIPGMKIWPFDTAAEKSFGNSISQKELEAGVKIIAAIRDEVGMDMDLMIELHGLWNRPTAKRIIDAITPYQPFWVEDPLRPDAVQALAKLRSEISVPIATGETAIGRRQILPLLEKGAVDYLTIDISWTGGLTESRKIASLADLFAVPVAPHDCSGPVALAISTHFSVSQRNGFLQETSRAFINTWYKDFVDGIPKIENGRIFISDTSGHGVTLQPWVRTSDEVFVRTSQAK